MFGMSLKKYPVFVGTLLALGRSLLVPTAFCSESELRLITCRMGYSQCYALVVNLVDVGIGISKGVAKRTQFGLSLVLTTIGFHNRRA